MTRAKRRPAPKPVVEPMPFPEPEPEEVPGIIVVHEDAEGALSIDGEAVEEVPVDPVDPVVEYIEEGNLPAFIVDCLRAEVDALEIKAEATGEATRSETDPLDLLDPGETVLAMRETDEAIIVVTSHGRKFAVDPDGWVSQSSGPDLCVVASGEDAAESADARAD